MYDTGILAIREHLRHKLTYICLHGFSGPFGPKWRFLGVWQNGKNDANNHPNELVLTFGVVSSVPLLAKSIKKCDHESADSPTHRHCYRDKLNL